MKILFVYPPSSYLNHSMFKHFTYFAETIDLVSKKYSHISVLDCAVEMKNRNQIYEQFRNADRLILLIEPYNIRQSLELMEIYKFMTKTGRTIVYGTAAALVPNYLSMRPEVDFVIANGNFAEAILHVLDSGRLPVTPQDKIINIEVEHHTWGCSLDTNVPLDLYKYWGNGMFEFTVQVGCPFHCSFCSEKILFPTGKGAVFAQRPVEEIISMLKRIRASYSSVYFSATTFTYDREWVTKLCKRIIEEDCIVPWRSDTRVDCLDEELLLLMKKAGLCQLSLGIETFEDGLLKRVNKHQTMDRIMETIHLCKETGVNVKALLILGLPGQTSEEVLRTQELVEKLEIPYRWKEYSPISELHRKDVRKEDVTEELDSFSRNTFLANSIEGISTEKYMQLLFPEGYVR